MTALALVAAAVLAGCESAEESPGAAQALVADRAPAATLEGHVWQPVDLTGCPVPWGPAAMVEGSGIRQREFTFTGRGSIRVRQVEVPDNPDTVDAYALAYSRKGSTLRVRAGLGVESWTVRGLTTTRLLLEDENGDECWLRRVR